MPTHLSLRKELHHSPTEAVAHFTNSAELTAIMLDAGSLNPRISVEHQHPHTWHVTVERTFEADWPSWIAGLVGDGLRIREERTWTLVDDALLTGTMELTVIGQPVTMRGIVECVAHESGSRISIEADVRAGIPLLGGKIEDVVCTYLKEGIEHEIVEFNNLD
ncbi:MAG: hypothetical protein RIS43_336 [Actinomycetota bacterium]|jgi:Protein of unknown function (DUF2505)